MILQEIHSMMQLTEDFFESDDQGEKEDVYENFKSILLEAQRWMFALMQHLEEEMRHVGGIQPKEPEPTRSLDELIQEAPEE